MDGGEVAALKSGDFGCIVEGLGIARRGGEGEEGGQTDEKRSCIKMHDGCCCKRIELEQCNTGEDRIEKDKAIVEEEIGTFIISIFNSLIRRGRKVAVLGPHVYGIPQIPYFLYW